jgi:arylsulfatase A-like enzyme/Tfp pilus assembly protein PilF
VDHPSRAWAVLLAATLLLSTACRARSARDFDLVLVTIDTVRADHVGAYGDGAAETPAIDRLAREGVRFADASAAVPLTLPSHATLLTGLLPPHHGLRDNGAGRLPGDVPTLAARLGADGYRTGAFVGAFVLDRRFGLDRGFERYDDEIDREQTEANGLAAERRGDAVTDRALAWLAQVPPGQRFFLWVHLYDAHAPYDPPSPFRERHAGRPYDGEIAFVDAQVDRLLAALEARHASDRTVVAVAADHGEELGEHGELTHGLLLYEPALRVPVVVRAPRVVPAGGVVRTPVSLADLPVTLAALLEHPMTGALDGRDLSGALRRGREPPAADVYAETEYPRTFGWAALAALRRGEAKFIRAPRPELYDLGRDPQESHDLMASAAGGAAGLSERIAALQTNARAVAPAADADARERLSALGYVAGGAGVATGASAAGTAADPKDRVALFRKFEEANWALNDGHADVATGLLEPLVRQDPGNAVFRGLLAKAWRRRGDLDRAVGLYRQAVAAAPQDPEARYNLAVTLQEAGRPEEARVAMMAAIQRDPGRPEAHNTLGIALFAMRRLDEAEAEFRRAADLDPRDPRSRNNLGNVLRARGRLDDAEQQYRRALELGPRYPDPLNGLGTLAVQLGRPAQAIPLFERCLALAPGMVEARLNLGIAQEMSGDAKAAAATYREVLAATGAGPGLARDRQSARQLLARLGSKPAGR